MLAFNSLVRRRVLSTRQLRFAHGGAILQPGRELTAMYEAGAARGDYNIDPHQVYAVKYLQRLYTELESYTPPDPTASSTSNESVSSSTPQGYHAPHRAFSDSEYLMTSLFGGFRKPAAAPVPEPAAVDSVTYNQPKGVYIHGGVGCGKTFLMDMFFSIAPVKRKRRVHFHSFMLEVHELMHEARETYTREGQASRDPVPHVADKLLNDSALLCFDEFQVTDVADALILRRLFSSMMARGMVVVATSNRPPDELYKNGLQREAFLPFIEELQQRCEVVDMTLSDMDHRLTKNQDVPERNFLHPLTPATAQQLQQQWEGVTAHMEVVEGGYELMTQGRPVPVPIHAEAKPGQQQQQQQPWQRVCRFTFEQLCGGKPPRGAADFIAIARHYDLVVVEQIPLLDLGQINQLRRFITLVDALYEEGTQLMCSAAAPPLQLFVAGGGPKEGERSEDMDELFAFSDQALTTDEAFAFDRTASRLVEMQSEEYRASSQK